MSVVGFERNLLLRISTQDPYNQFSRSQIIKFDKEIEQKRSDLNNRKTLFHPNKERSHISLVTHQGLLALNWDYVNILHSLLI